jgi:hypothetical protein
MVNPIQPDVFDNCFRWLVVSAGVADDHRPDIFEVINLGGSLFLIGACIETYFRKEARAVLVKDSHTNLTVLDGSLRPQPTTLGG